MCCCFWSPFRRRTWILKSWSLHWRRKRPIGAAEPNRAGQIGGGKSHRPVSWSRYARGDRQNERPPRSNPGERGGEISGSNREVDRGRGRRGHRRTGGWDHLIAGNRSQAARGAGELAQSEKVARGSSGEHRATKERFGL